MWIIPKVVNRYFKLNVSQAKLLCLSSKPAPPEIIPISVHVRVIFDYFFFYHPPSNWSANPALIIWLLILFPTAQSHLRLVRLLPHWSLFLPEPSKKAVLNKVTRIVLLKSKSDLVTLVLTKQWVSLKPKPLHLSTTLYMICALSPLYLSDLISLYFFLTHSVLDSAPSADLNTCLVCCLSQDHAYVFSFSGLFTSQVSSHWELSVPYLAHPNYHSPSHSSLYYLATFWCTICFTYLLFVFCLPTRIFMFS
jgi:hypothetical protein